MGISRTFVAKQLLQYIHLQKVCIHCNNIKNKYPHLEWHTNYHLIFRITKCFVLVELHEDLEIHVTYLLPKLLLFLITSDPPLKDE